jgi:hypothetical protein
MRICNIVYSRQLNGKGQRTNNKGQGGKKKDRKTIIKNKKSLNVTYHRIQHAGAANLLNYNKPFRFTGQPANGVYQCLLRGLSCIINNKKN